MHLSLCSSIHTHVSHLLNFTYAKKYQKVRNHNKNYYNPRVLLSFPDTQRRLWGTHAKNPGVFRRAQPAKITDCLIIILEIRHQLHILYSFTTATLLWAISFSATYTMIRVV